MTAAATAAGRRRVALFLPCMGGGGAERVALALIQGFRNSGWDIDLVLASRQGALMPLIPDGVTVINLGAPRARQILMPLVRYFRERPPVAMHVMMWPLPMLAVIARAIAGADTRIVGSEHVTLSKMPHALRHRPVRVLTRWAYRRLDGIIAVSNGVADDVAHLIGLARGRIQVIHNPLLLPSPLPPAGALAARWVLGTRRLLAVGEFKGQKNYNLMLQAIALLRDRMPVSLLILGDGVLEPEVRAEVDRLGLRDIVIFAGFELNVWPYFAAAELLVLSSDYEGLPTVLIEALHAGLPIVSTDCPSGPREILLDGKLGTLVPCGDAVLLAAGVEQALSASHDEAAMQLRAAELSGQDAMVLHSTALIGTSH